MAKTKLPAETLSAIDLLSLHRTSSDEKLAQANVDLCRVRMQSLEFQAKLAMHELQTAARTAEDALAAAKKQGKLLADDVASRYAFDWATTTYDDTTGQLSRVD
jgi:hypothetical protein